MVPDCVKKFSVPIRKTTEGPFFEMIFGISFENIFLLWFQETALRQEHAFLRKTREAGDRPAQKRGKDTLVRSSSQPSPREAEGLPLLGSEKRLFKFLTRFTRIPFQKMGGQLSYIHRESAFSMLRRGASV